MRPNRIGAWPRSLNALADTSLSAVENLHDHITSAFAFQSMRTEIDGIELICGITDISDTIYSRTLWYNRNHVVELTESFPRVSFGGFMTASGIRDVNTEPQPMYVRVVGHALCNVQESDHAITLQPIIGIKANSDAPVQLHTTAAKLTRALSVGVCLPVGNQHRHVNDNHSVHYANVDQTILLGQYFTRFGGVGYSGDTIFGVGWSVLQTDNTSDASLHIAGFAEFAMSVWMYTADIDVYDPNKS